MTTGERIQVARKKAGLTQEQLAQKIDSATITVRQYESGKRVPRIEQLRKIASALDISFMYLLGADLPGVHTIDEAVEDHKNAMKRKDIDAGLQTILEAIYGKRHEQIVQGKWLSASFAIYGEGENALTLGDDAMFTIHSAVQALVESLVSTLKEDVETVRIQLKEGLSSPEAEAVVNAHKDDDLRDT